MVGKNADSPNRAKSPKRLSLSLTGSFISATHSLIPAACKISSSSANMSAEVTSTLVTGSAATTSQRTGVGDAATALSTRSLNSSALAKNNGASQRNRTRPGIRLAFG
ncbi:hypothetical protein D3C84_890670 [compost metagenome]